MCYEGFNMQETTTFSALQAQRLANEANLNSRGCQLILTQIKLAAAEGRYEIALQLTSDQANWLKLQGYTVTKAGTEFYYINWN